MRVWGDQEMSLINALRTGIKVADKVLKSGGMEAEVQFSHYVSSNGYGDKTFLSAVPLRAVVDWKQRQLRTTGGVLSVSRASVMFLDVAALLTATNGEGVNDEDIITLPDGTTGPILDMGGYIDGGTGHPVATEVFLG
jgi:hypothetical protein